MINRIINIKRILLPAVAVAMLLPLTLQAERHGSYRKCVASGRQSADVEVFDCYSVDREPQFPGGESAMVKFINANRRYPRNAYNNGVHGRVTCGFVVDTDGSLVSIEVLRGVHPALDREAVRVISSMPNWEAGRLNGVSVPTYYTLTIPFRL